MITQTNGVDFKLGTGTICAVWFTNGWRLNANDLDPGSWTLNVNSTGATQVQVARSKSQGYGKDITWTTQITSGRYISSNRLLLAVYTGSYYYAITGFAEYYIDYSD